MKQNKAAIIMVTYNRSDVSNLAFDSLARAKNQTPFTVIVVDNQSRDIEQEKMKRVFESLVNSGQLSGRFFCNDSNSGYAAGNNIGIKFALEDPSVTHVCLLNNDTIVSDGWLDGLITRSEKALVGPVSNSVGNEQIVGTDYRIFSPDGYSREIVREFASKWQRYHLDNVVHTKMLGFFCVLGERKLFEEVGFLDEVFGIGYYEDDDFCVRCRKHGYDLKIVREVFVHHWGSASFSAVGDDLKEKLMVKNRTIFERKHQVKWTPPKDSWALSLGHEIEWFKNPKSRHLTSAEAEEIGLWFTQSVRNEAFSLCSRPDFVPGGLFRSYLRDGVVARLPRHFRKLPKWLLGAFLLIFEYLASPEFDRPNVIRKSKIWKAWCKFRSEINLLLRRLKSGQKSHAVIIFPIQPYAGRKQRPQHIAEGLAHAGNQVFWVDPPLDNRGSWAGPRKIELANIESVRGLLLLKPYGYDFENFYVTGWSTRQANEFLKEFGRHLRKLGIDINSSTLVVQSPFWANLVKQFPGRVIYECMDAHDEFGSATAEVGMLEEDLLRFADSILVTSEYLQKKIEKQNHQGLPVSLVRNGCDPEHFISRSMSPVTKEQARKTVGYFGAVAEWFDEDLLIEAARFLPEIQFEVIGNHVRSKIGTSKLPENLFLLGEKDYQRLPELTAHWSAALIPFKLTNLILATNPVKLYEYSALGLPVISTPIPEVQVAEIPVYIGSNGKSFAREIARAIEEDSIDRREERKAFARKNSWNSRVEQIQRVIQNFRHKESKADRLGDRDCADTRIPVKS